MPSFDEYEDRMGQCQMDVEDHMYRVVTYRRCRNKARWIVRGRWAFGAEFEKKLCTRHKNDMVKYAHPTKYEIISVEELNNG